MRMEKRGVSLIVLIITIIVIIILTSVVIIKSGNDEGIIGESGNIIDEYNRNVIIDELKQKIQLGQIDKEINQHKKFTIQNDAIPILQEYGQYNNTTLELITPNNGTIMLYEIILIPMEEYVNPSLINGVLTVTTQLSNTFTIQYSIDNGASWIRYTQPISINDKQVLLRIIDKNRNEISNRLEVNTSNDVNVIDTRAPLIVVMPNKIDIANKADVKISVLDSGGLAQNNSYQYYLSTSSTTQAGGSWINYTNGNDITIGTGLNGIYYIHVKKVSDISGNESEPYVSGPFVFDNIKPTVNVSISKVEDSKYNISVTLSDNNSMDFNKCRYKLTQTNTALGNTINNYTDGKLNATSKTIQIGVCGQYYFQIIATDRAGNTQTYISSVIEGDNTNYGTVLSTSTYSYTGGAQTVSLTAGKYKLEAWGAQGNDANNGRASGGNGAYVSGSLDLTNSLTMYVYVGEHRSDRNASFNAGSTGGSGSDTVNGGSTNGYGGGGATDFRLVSGTWNVVDSLRSRIMVAGGGGGATNYAYPASGGYGGALIGGNGANGKYPNVGVPNTPPKGATQTTGGTTSVLTASGGVGTVGSFGVGGNGNKDWGSGGGGGYYGGAGGGYTSNSVDSGAGGSSFVSGYAGCNAINSSGAHTGGNIHYSNHKFINPMMLAGNEQIPTYNGTSKVIGNTGNGYAKVTKYSQGYKYTDEQWNGKANIRWYVNNTSATTYNIGTAEELAGLAILTANVGKTVYYDTEGYASTTTGTSTTTGLDFSGKTINLTSDIVLNLGKFSKTGSAYFYTPEGGSAIPIASLTSSNINSWTPGGVIAGTLNGQGYKISGVYINISGNASLFDNITATGRLEGIGIENSYIRSTASTAAAFSGAMVGVMNKCYSANSYIIGASTVGGLVTGFWSNTTTIINCYNASEVSTTVGTTGGCGGIAGDAYGSYIVNCYNVGSVNGVRRVGGMTGSAGYSQRLTAANFYNAGQLTASSSYLGFTHGYTFNVTSSYLYALSSYVTAAEGYHESGSYSITNVSAFSGSGTNWTLSTAVAPNGTSTNNLLTALNAWVSANGGKYNNIALSNWKVDATKNGGLPIFDWQ